MKILHVLFIVGAVALFGCVLRPYLLLDAGWVMVLVLIVCLVTGATVFQSLDDRSLAARIVATSVPWLCAAVLLVNGALDSSPEELHQTSVLDTYYGGSWDRVVVRSWRPGQRDEALYLKTTFFHPGTFHHEGDTVLVGVKRGALGIPWVSSLLP